MADTINATDLPLETSTTLDGTEKIIGFDVNQGKAITVAELAEYILQKKVSSLAGSNQTLAAALTALNSKLSLSNTLAIDDALQWALTVDGFGICYTNANTLNLPQGNPSGGYGLLMCEAWHPNSSSIWIRLLWFPTASVKIYTISKTNSAEWLAWSSVN